MALRRPAPPRLHAGRPGVTPLSPPAPGRAVASSEAATPTSSEATTPAPSEVPTPARSEATTPTPAAAPAPAPRAIPRRRTILLAGGAAAAVAAPATVGAFMLRGSAGEGAVSAPWSSDSGPVGHSGSGGAVTSSPFSDVPDDAADLDAMVWADEIAIQPALADGAYAPAQPVGRGELAAVLHRFAGGPDLAADSLPAVIADLDEDPEHGPALLWLFGRGAIWCDEQLRLRPAADATHDETVATLTALLRPALVAIGSTWDPADASVPSGIADEDATDLRWLTAAQVMPAETDGWSGGAPLTRAQLAAVLHQANTVITRCLP